MESLKSGIVRVSKASSMPVTAVNPSVATANRGAANATMYMKLMNAACYDTRMKVKGMPHLLKVL